jgi:hypothetical protein
MIYVTFAHAPAMRETGDISGPLILCQETDWQFVLTSRELFRTVTFDLTTAQIRTAAARAFGGASGALVRHFLTRPLCWLGSPRPKICHLLAEPFPPCQSP